MRWEKLITSTRLGQEERHPERLDDRSEFKRDYDRLIFSAPFRRMQNKTQVFPLPGSVFVHNRLTHSLEVASVGQSLGTDVSRIIMKDRPELADTLFPEIGTIVSAACLAHDMGNPPFGHSGEKALQTFFTEGKGQFLKTMVSDIFWSDITHFEGNANAFRLLAHRFKGRREGGFAMTYSMLASIVKYPYASYLADARKQKFGFFHTEADTFKKIAEELGIPQNGQELSFARFPLVFLMEAADDICYEIMDMEDAHKLKLTSFEATKELLFNFMTPKMQNTVEDRMRHEQISNHSEQVAYFRACVIGLLERACVETFVANEKAILDGSFHSSLIDCMPDRERTAYKKCVDFSYRNIYNSKPVLDVEMGGYKIIETLMDVFIEAVVNPDRYYSRQLLGRVGSQYDILSDNLEDRVMAVIDYVSGMTDVYALDVYQKINGISLPIV
ncbi:MAG: dNTP triphosphohydrolase [Bacteroidaceae bacterium]|nr:dNTP triphosphohydrolase [Bacteroidaceae bacterium]